MSKKLKLKNHIDAFAEISNILSAMKNLSLMEISKTNKFSSLEKQVVMTLDKVIFDFGDFHPEILSFFLVDKPKAFYSDWIGKRILW